MQIGKRLYALLIAPRQRDEDLRNREIVLNVLLAGTLAVVVAGFLLIVAKAVIGQDAYLLGRGAITAVIAGFVAALCVLSRRGFHKTATYMLVGVYFLLASALAYQWGINIPISVLLYGLVIVLAGILLGPSYSLYAAGVVAVTLTAFVQATDRGLIHPDWSWTTDQPGMIDVAGFSLIFGIIALVSWLFNYQMERSLHRAERAESALRKQKGLLESTVEERTRELQTAQLENIREMYRFAELGQLSTALLHDLANHLTTLTLDIEGLEGQTRSRALSRAKRSIHYIDDMVIRVRDQLHGRSHIRTFNVASEIDEMVSMLTHRAQTANVTLTWRAPANKKMLRCRGEPIRFRQLMANLISNAIDAYYTDGPTTDRREVVITADIKQNNLVITVNDWGRGIPTDVRAKLFEPFYSTKKSGMGMGLYIVKQIAEEHFLGSVYIDQAKSQTAFVVTLPKAGA